MSTASSPLKKLQAQAERIAKTLKAAERGEKIDPRFAAKLDEARAKDVFKVGIIMDDKIITLDLPWATVKAETEAGLSDFIVDQMRKKP